MMRRTWWAAGALVLAGCGSGGAVDDTSLSEAWCSDLEAGRPPLGMMMDQYPGDGQKGADEAYGMTAVSCPEQLVSNEQLRVFLESFGIDPDA
jgi:hypothetical protein